MSKLVNKLCILVAFLLICADVFFSARMMTSSEIISADSVSDLNIRFTFSDLSVADSRLWFNEADGRYYAFIGPFCELQNDQFGISGYIILL